MVSKLGWRAAMGQRLEFKEGLRLFQEAPLGELQRRAVELRNLKTPPERVTYVLDSNPNYTNICHVACSFCAFYRTPKAPDAYTETVDQVMEHLSFARKLGLSTVLLQGGLNNALDLSYYVSLVSRARQDYPDIWPHFFSAPEIDHCARMSKVSIREALQALWDAGQRTLPGGGAEILSEKVHRKISPNKITPKEWIEMHRIAHRLGYRSTATMMYGHVEQPEDILIHLDALRQVQDETGGFTAFIPWSFKGDHTALQKQVHRTVSEEDYFRLLAFSRIYLDNFDHIQASWFGEGKAAGVESLKYGADDFGGIIVEENVHRCANFVNKTTHQGIIEMIRSAGYTPVERNPIYSATAHKIEVTTPEDGGLRSPQFHEQ